MRLCLSYWYECTMVHDWTVPFIHGFLTGCNPAMSEAAAGVVYAMGDVGMSGMPGDELARKPKLSGQSKFGPLPRRGRALHLRLLLSGTLALGSMIALPLPALSQAPPAQTSPAQTAPATRTAPHKKPVAAAIPEPAPPPQPAVAPSLFEQPPAPATVTAHANELTVKADNSSLTQILHQVSSATGMRLDGLGGDERVFGSFGPGAPREVLTALLNGTSYNVVMVGDLPNGAPRALLLSRRAAGGGSPQPAAAAAANQNQTHNGDEDNPDDSANSDDSDDSPPPQYDPPSIAPATPTPQSDTGAPQAAPQSDDTTDAPPPPQIMNRPPQ